jgi:uncharacterized protein (TIGR02001 family)
VWRNVSQSNYDLAIQGGIDVTTSSGFYVGTWASSIDFNDASDANVEVDVYGGYRFDLGGVAADVGRDLLRLPGRGRHRLLRSVRPSCRKPSTR